MSANLTLRSLTGGTTNTTKNAPLTNAEMDQNLINLDNEIDGKLSASNPSYTGNLTGGAGTVNFNGQFVKDTVGNVGVGVAPSAVGDGREIQIASDPAGNTGSFGSKTQAVGSGRTYIASNARNTAFSTDAYRVNGRALKYQQDTATGVHYWYTAPIGTAGNAIGFLQNMALWDSGLSVLSGAPQWAPSSTDGLFASGSASGTSYLTTYLDASTLQIGAGITQKTGLVIYGQSTGSGSKVAVRTGGVESAFFDSNGAFVLGPASATSGYKINTDGSALLGNNHNLSWGVGYAAGGATISGNSGNISFYPDGATSGEKFRMNSNGQLFVGNAGSSFGVEYKFQVAGRAIFNDSTLVLRSTGNLASTGIAYYSMQSSDGVERGWMGFGNGDASMRVINTVGGLILQSTGGTATLDSSGNLSLSSGFLQAASGTSSAYFGNAEELITGAPAGAAAIRTDGGPLIIGISSTEVARFDTNGRLGINKTPNANLDYRESVDYITTSATAVASRTHIIAPGVSLTLTMPTSPVNGDWVEIIDRSGTGTCVIARNGVLIMGVAEDFTIDLANFSAKFVYSLALGSWVIV